MLLVCLEGRVSALLTSVTDGARDACGAKKRVMRLME